MSVAILDPIRGVAALTPFGDLEDTLAAIARGERAGQRDERSGVVAPLAAIPAAHRHARIAGALPALAIEVARRATRPIADDRAEEHRASAGGATGEPALAGILSGSRTGIFVGVGDLQPHWNELRPAMANQAPDASGSWARGLARLHPLWMLRYLSNAAHALVAAELGFVGDGATFSGAAAAASAIVAAEAALSLGTIDAALVLALADVTPAEGATELAARRGELVPAAAIAALVVTKPRPDSALLVEAVDGIDPDHAEPSPAAIARVRARLAPTVDDVSYRGATGWASAATPLVDLVVAARLAMRGALRSATIVASGSPGQIGVIRVARSERGEPRGVGVGEAGGATASGVRSEAT